MSRPYQPNLLNKRQSRDTLEEKPRLGPDDAATQTITPEELSRLKRRCIDEHHEIAASQNTQVAIGKNRVQTNRLVAETENDRLIPQPESFRVEPLENRLSADATLVVTSTRSSSQYQKATRTTLSDCSNTLLHRRREQSDTRIIGRTLFFRRADHLWSKYRIGIFIAVCTVVSLVVFLGNPISDNAQTELPPIPPQKALKPEKTPISKPNSTIEVKQEADSRPAQATKQLQDEARSPTPLPEGRSSELERSLNLNERIAVDLLITGRLRTALNRYCELALQRRDRPVYRVIARALSRQIARSHPQHTLPGNDLCRISNTE